MLSTTTPSTLTSLLLLVATATAHTVITYPGWRGNNLHSNGTYSNLDVIPGSRGMNWDEDEEAYTYPYGMQWMYPCGGMPTSTNRTKWPIGGGAVAVQPGWFQGHQSAFFYINLGIGTEPKNMSHPMVPVFQIAGPSNDEYPGTFCLPQVPLPANITFEVGDNVTIQVVETAVHGAALYNCVDVTLADPSEVEEVTEENCFNSTTEKQRMGFNLVFTSTSLQPDNLAASLLSGNSVVLTYLPYAFILLTALLWT